MKPAEMLEATLPKGKSYLDFHQSLVALAET